MSSQKGKKKMATRSIPAPPSQQRDKVMRDLVKRDVAGDHIDAVMAMMDPGLLSSAPEIPARSPWMRSCTVESTVLKLSNNDGSVDPVTGRFAIEARARPNDTLITTNTGSDVEDANPILVGLIVNKAVNSAAEADFDIMSAAHNAMLIVRQLGTIAAGGTAYVLPIGSTAGGTKTILITGSTLAHRLTVRPYTGPIGALVAGVAAVLPVAVDAGGPATLTLPALTTFVSFTYNFVGSADAGRKLSAQASLLTPSGGGLSTLTPSSRSYSLTTLTGVNKLRAYRIAGQSLLLTYTGSMINNGGEIAIARVSAAWTPDPGKSVYESLLLLPKSRRYAGKVAKGAHSFWVPESVEDFDPKLYGLNYSELEKPSYKIVAAGTLDDATESIMLQLETIVEFQSDDPSYASVSYAPPWNSFDVAIHALANINPCGENPNHIKRIRKWASKELKNLVKWAIDNPEFVSALTSAAVKAIV